MNRITLLLLSLGLSFAPVFCWAAEPNADQAKAAAEIKKMGGRIKVDEKSPGKPVIDVVFFETTLTDAGLVHVSRLTKLKRLTLEDTQVTDAGLVHLSGLSNLQWLDLWGTKVGYTGLVHLKGLTPT